MFACLKPPDPPELKESKEIDKKIGKLIKRDYEEFRKTIKFLLLGTGESGKTTILKQMRILHINGFSHEDKIEKISSIRQNIHESIYAIISSAAKINPPVEIEDTDAKRSADYILTMGPKEPDSWDNDYVNHVKILWQNRNVQEVYARSNEYQLIDSAQYFLDKIAEINEADYVPTVQDILHCRIMTVAISKVEFKIKGVPFCMIDVGGQRGHRKKWISVFDGIRSVLFLIAASDFDQTLREDENTNRLSEAFIIFEEMYKSRFLREAAIIVFLNKQDILQKKIENGKRIENYFPDYRDFNPPKLCNNEYEKAQLFLKQKITDIKTAQQNEVIVYIVKGVPVKKRIGDREAYIHLTIATDTKNIKHVFADVEDLIFKSNLENVL